MPAYLIDVNLPFHFPLWKKEGFVFVKEINDEWTDSQIWNYALDNNLIIVTKDTDFFDRVMVSKRHPKVIHVCFGNMLLKEFADVMGTIWQQILALDDQYELIKVYKDKIVIIK
jgi:predicted nuclease of predicted toxin-antitoxin system